MDNSNMSFNTGKECTKLTKIINKTFLYLPNSHEVMYGRKINFLIEVLKLTMEYPQVESYLKDLLNYFTVNELEKIADDGSILHCILCDPYKISLGAFEMIINYGININIKNDSEYCTSTHILLRNQCSEHINNILNLLIKHGADLNIKNIFGCTVLDLSTHHQFKLNEETRNCIMILIDFGATTYNAKSNNEIHDFIEYYKSSTIKPAIKKMKI